MAKYRLNLAVIDAMVEGPKSKNTICPVCGNVKEVYEWICRGCFEEHGGRAKNEVKNTVLALHMPSDILKFVSELALRVYRNGEVHSPQVLADGMLLEHESRLVGMDREWLIGAIYLAKSAADAELWFKRGVQAALEELRKNPSWKSELNPIFPKGVGRVGSKMVAKAQELFAIELEQQKEEELKQQKIRDAAASLRRISGTPGAGHNCQTCNGKSARQREKRNKGADRPDKQAMQR
jgi:hypothetical protein